MTHTLLQRQLRRHGIDPDPPPAGWESFLRAVDEAYEAFEHDHAMLERSLDLSSTELFAANNEMRAAGEVLRATLESTADGILAVDGAGRIIHANDRFLGYWDIGAEIVASGDGAALLKAFLPRMTDPEWALARLKEVLARPDATLDTMPFKDGSIFECYSRPLLGPRGIDGRVFSYRDVTERHRAAEALKESEERFRTLVQNSSDMIVIVDRTGVPTYASPSVTRIMGYSNEAWRGVNITAFLHPEDYHRGAQSLFEVLAQPGLHPPTEVRLQHSDGSWRDIELIANNLLEAPAVGGIVFNARDITERKQAETALRESEERFRSLVQNSSDVITVIDEDRVITYQSPSLARVLGFPADLAIGQQLLDRIHPDDVSVLRAFLSSGLGRTDVMSSVEVRVGHADGSWRYMEVVGADLRNDPAVGGYVLNARDITERKSLEEQLRHHAFHDPLTSLANRARFRDRLEHALTRAGRAGARLAVVFLDLDNFKSINDGLGHAAGDRLLVEAADRIRGRLRPGDTAARFGGDEFALILEDVADAADAVGVAGRVLSALREPYHLENTEVFAHASIGVALSDTAGDTAEGLLRNADVAMYVAKNRGKARVELYEDSMHLSMHEHLQLLTEMQRGLERGEFTVEYQPTVELSTSAIVGVEALVRWNHPRRGLVGPSEFIPLAEEAGVITALGRWVLRQACRQMKEWHDRFQSDPPLYVSVNVSGRQMQPEIVDEVRSALLDTGLSPQCLVLELTESVMMHDVPSTVAILDQLKDLGVRLAIDDFGTGYSSLSYIRQFPFDILKIDKSFVDDAGGASERELTSAIVEIGRMLHLEVIAEGIERADQFTRLRALNCESGQGYYFAKPLPPADFEKILSRGDTSFEAA